MNKNNTITRIKRINKKLLSLGFTEQKILKFWRDCKNEVKLKKLTSAIGRPKKAFNYAYTKT